MPFRESGPVEERVALMMDYESGAFSVVELCTRYGISRETFYVWKRRREGGDARWFEDLSRSPGSCRHATAPEVIAAIVAMRARFPRFGPKKIKARLARDDADIAWPAASTIGGILKREGLIAPKQRRRKPIGQGEIIAGSDEPNGEWAIDFKGWFRTADGRRCDPLTVSDTASRYLIETRITPPTHLGVKAVMELVFEHVGLPEAIRSDNGAPFGSAGAGGLSRLSVWLLKLGIEPRFIPPASPQDNGRHERMHRTLKAETTKPPAHSWEQQQVRFDIFRQAYNEERPHEASARPRRRAAGSRRTAGCRAASRSRGTTPIIRCAVSAATARSSGAANTSSSARRWPASRSASSCTSAAAISCASWPATSGRSTTPAGSIASLRHARGCARR
jgi:transposase InsO family protein